MFFLLGVWLSPRTFGDERTLSCEWRILKRYLVSSAYPGTSPFTPLWSTMDYSLFRPTPFTWMRWATSLLWTRCDVIVDWRHRRHRGVNCISSRRLQVSNCLLVQCRRQEHRRCHRHLSSDVFSRLINVTLLSHLGANCSYTVERWSCQVAVVRKCFYDEISFLGFNTYVQYEWVRWLLQTRDVYSNKYMKLKTAPFISLTVERTSPLLHRVHIVKNTEIFAW